MALLVAAGLVLDVGLELVADALDVLHADGVVLPLARQAHAGQQFADVAGQDVVVELGLVLDGLDAQEDEAQGGRDADVQRGVLEVALGGGVVGQHDGEAGRSARRC